MPPLSAMNAEPKIATGVSLESSSIDHREPTEAPLPAYSSSLWSSSGKAPYNAPVLQSPPRRPDPVLRRFNRACVAALVLWLLIHLVGDFWKNASGFQLGGEAIGDESSKVLASLESDLLLGHPEPPFLKVLNFSLPPSRSYRFFNQGGPAYGYFKVVTSDKDYSEQNEVLVDVTIRYYEEEALDFAKVRLEEDSENDSCAIGIYVEEIEDSKKYHRLRFDLIVRLPRPSGAASPLVLDHFRTDFTTFVHHFGDLERLVLFNVLNLNAANVPMAVDSLWADNATLVSSNGPIVGNFSINGTLVLSTSNAPIHAGVSLYSAGLHKPSSVILNTANGPLSANVSLFTSSTDSALARMEYGNFSVSAYTSNAPLSLSILEQLPDSRLSLEAATRNSPAHVKLHPAYAGRFLVSSTLLRPVVDRSDVDSYPDPAGKGRKRSVEIGRMDSRTIEGQVWWGEEDERNKENEGSVTVSTSILPAVLKL